MHSATPTGECRSWNAHASLLCILFLTVALLVGCGEEPVYIAAGTEAAADSGGDAEAGDDADGAKAAEDAGTANDGDAESQTDGDSGASGTLYVYVCGAVKVPGVYTLDEGSRVYDAIAAAGGLREDASEDYWNQAAYVSDGQMIDVPTEEEVAAGLADSESVSSGSGSSDSDSAVSSADASSGSSQGSKDASDGATGSSGRININTATAEELTQIPGIGDARAAAIISYREQTGGFSDIEDIKNVSGIGDALFEKMKDYIEV